MLSVIRDLQTVMQHRQAPVPQRLHWTPELV
jgi:hypothetical protein